MKARSLNALEISRRSGARRSRRESLAIMISKKDLYALRDIKAEMAPDLKELRQLESAKQKKTEKSGSILHSLTKSQPEDIQLRIDILREKLIKKQEEYLVRQSILEQQLAEIPNHDIRVVLSLVFVDLQSYKAAASMIGGSATAGGLQQLISRYFAKGEFHDSS